MFATIAFSALQSIGNFATTRVGSVVMALAIGFTLGWGKSEYDNHVAKSVESRRIEYVKETNMEFQRGLARNNLSSQKARQEIVDEISKNPQTVGSDCTISTRRLRRIK